MSIPQTPSPLANIVASKTYNAAWFSGNTKEAQITAAIAAAVADGALYVYVPANMLPYNASAVTFNNTVQMLREGSGSTGDVKAYGAAGDGATDDTAAILAWSSLISTIDCGTAICTGTFKITSKIFIGPAAGTCATKTITMSCTFNSAFISSDEVIQIRNCAYVDMLGHWEVNGYITGAALNYATRQNYDGVLIAGTSTGRINIESLKISNFSRRGLSAPSSATNSNTSLIKYLGVVNCGSGKSTSGSDTNIVESNFSAVSQTGGSNSVGQLSVLTVDVVPPQLTVGDFAIVNGISYLVAAINAGALQVSLYPWLPNATLTGVVRWAIGAGLYLAGNNTNNWNISSIDAQTCATGYRCMALYPPTVGLLQAATCLVAFGLGTTAVTSSVGGSIAVCYVESDCTFQVIQVTQVVVSFFIGSAGSAIFSAWVQMAPNNGTGTQIATVMGVVAQLNGITFGKQTSRGNQTASAASPDLTPRPIPTFSYYRDTFALTLTETADVNRLWGYDTIAIYAQGTGTNRQPTGTWTFTAQATYTVNGGTSFVVSGMRAPELFICHLNVTTKDWHVTRYQSYYDSLCEGWSQVTTVAINQTDVALADVLTPRGRIMSRAGSVVGLAINLSTVRSAGTVTVKVQKSTDAGATWATMVDVATGLLNPSVAISSAISKAQAAFIPGTYIFAAGDMLRLTVTTNGTFAPTANNLDAMLAVTS